ncbi:zinc ribbon domain-containing protein [Paenibacillus glucanolyticus]|uniref:zinc ribbon domain-containing protein n=1 Tax=Paenibacillus glucanolyticus TaxID=59843 RepID=UPI0030C9AC75
MSFFDKFKAGVSDAGNKAKILVEVNRLKLQNNGKKSDIDEQLLEIGKVVFAATEAGQRPPEEESIQSYVAKIHQLNFEIEQNLLHIANLTDEKVCRGCGNSSALNAKFCAHCGRTFEVIQVQSEELRKEIPLLEETRDQEEPK